jgi:hypothetical protein
MASVPRYSSVKVGTRYMVPSWTKELLSNAVVHSNWLFLDISKVLGSSQAEKIDPPITIKSDLSGPELIDTSGEIIVHDETPGRQRLSSARGPMPTLVSYSQLAGRRHRSQSEINDCSRQPVYSRPNQPKRKKKTYQLLQRRILALPRPRK